MRSLPSAWCSRATALTPSATATRRAGTRAAIAGWLLFLVAACNPAPGLPPSQFSVKLQLDKTTVFEGETAQATTTVTDQNGRIVTSLAVPLFTAGNPGTASVNVATGAITALAAGQTWIYATVVDPNFLTSRDSVLFTVLRRPVATVRVSAVASSLPEGYTTVLSATPFDVNGDTLRNRAAPTFLSSDTTVLRTGAVAGNTSTATAIAAGQATVTATIEGVAGVRPMSVTPPAVARVTATLTPATLRAGGKATITLVVTDTGGRVVASGVPAFSTSNSTVATVTPATPRSASVTAVSVGTAAIRATLGGKADSAVLQVTPTAVNSIQIRLVNPQQPLYPTRTAAITATPYDSTGTVLPNRTVSITVRNPGVATVTQSTVNFYTATATGVSVGSTFVIARADSATDSLRVTVLTPPLTSVQITLPTNQLTIGQTVGATVTGIDAIGGVVAQPTVSWDSRNPTVASVTASGLVTGVAAGVTDIIASASDSVADTVRVSVSSPTNLPAKFIATGPAHTIVIDSGGTAYGTGRNSTGQLGRGTVTVAESTFAPVAGADKYKQASLGSGHTVLLTVAGVVKTMGSNFAGQLGDNTTVNRSTPVTYNIPELATLVAAGANTTCARGVSGKLYCAGTALSLGFPANESVPQVVSGAFTVLDVSIGNDFMCMATTDPANRLLCRGKNNHKQVDGTGVNTLNWARVTIPPQTGPDAVTFGWPTLARSSALADGMALPLAAGWESMCYSPPQEDVIGGRNRQTLCWGHNQLRDVSDRSVSPLYPPEWYAVPVANFTDIPGIEVARRGLTNTQVLSTSGSLIGVGYNFFGQMGNGAFANVPSWVEMAQGRKFLKLAGSAEAYIGCAIDAILAAWCWGRNDSGQLGIGKLTVRETTPVPVRKP